MKGLSTRASAACLLLCCCKIDFSPFLPHAHKRFAVPKPCVLGTDKLEEIRNWGMGAVVVSQVLSHPQSQTQQALSPRKKKCKNKFAQMSSTTDLSLNFTLPVFQNIAVHLLWGLVPHPTMRPQNCQHLLLPLCAYGKQVPTCHLCHQLGLWQGKKKEQVLTSLQRQLRFGTQLLKSDMSMQAICAWKAFQGKFSIPFLSLCMRHSTFNSIPQDGNR